MSPVLAMKLLTWYPSLFGSVRSDRKTVCPLPLTMSSSRTVQIGFSTSGSGFPPGLALVKPLFTYVTLKRPLESVVISVTLVELMSSPMKATN